MLSPKPGEWEKAKEIISQREIDAYRKNITFDPIYGWGHRFEKPDFPKNSNEKFTFTSWKWHGVEADQGFGYYWPKYEKKSVTIILKMGHRAQNWGCNENGTLVRERVFDDPFTKYMNPLPLDNKPGILGLPDHHHFLQGNKPWRGGPPPDISIFNSTSRLKSPKHLWFHTLMIIDQDLGMGLNFTNWQTVKEKMPLNKQLQVSRQRTEETAKRAGLVG